MAPISGATDAEGPGIDAGPLVLSAGQLNTFGTCEMQWLLNRSRPERDDEPGSRPDYFKLGDAVHAGIQAWGLGTDIAAALALVFEEAEPGFDLDEWEAPAWFKTAQTIMDAWVAEHGPKSPVPWVAVELPFDVEIPGTRGVRIRGWIDGLKRLPGPDRNPNHDTFRVVEIKTMGRWGRERRVPFANDTWLYLWAVRLLVPRLTGLDFEAISTYPSKAADYERLRPTSVEWDERHAERMLNDLRRTAKRATAIVKNPALAVRSVGEACDRCPHQVPCLRPWELES